MTATLRISFLGCICGIPDLDFIINVDITMEPRTGANKSSMDVIKRLLWSFCFSVAVNHCRFEGSLSLSAKFNEKVSQPSRIQLKVTNGFTCKRYVDGSEILETLLNKINSPCSATK